MFIRMLEKAPYEVRYADFNYLIEPVTAEEGGASYIAARAITAKGKLWEPRHEYELTARAKTETGAAMTWSTGFKTKDDSFISRQLIARLLDQGAAEEVAPPVTLVTAEAESLESAAV